MARGTGTSSAKMKDVAERAGVSIKTVSRVLNNEPHVQEKLRQKVREAAEALDYVPSQSARSLRGNRSYDINLVCHVAGSNYVNSIQFGAVFACQELGYQLSISLLENLGGKSIAEIRSAFEGLMRRRKPDGVVLLAPYANDEKIGFVLNEMGIQVVRVGPVDGTQNQGLLVEIDDYQASIDVVRHLTNLGHKRIGFVRGSQDQRSAHVRYSGFCVAMEAAGLVVDQELVRPGAFDFAAGYDAGVHFLGLKQPPTAVFASNDDMAAGVVAACTERGVKVPDDLSIVGFDDAEIATRMRPFLTTIRQPLHDLGARAIHELIGSFNSSTSKNSAHRVVLDHELIIRDTTGSPPK
ncbi:LacI family DNA-binding transcriptional regulator [Erythrobacter crassostreae]|uniref:LacI family DNA-binding transcriptional regulator n=1 Tax=Erythrobacter crassostreae TaxID=2828328 RepID=A0A9X1F500_9SPHN|nr:LacI family DNA-binding transcriptional regulator [Erythrobacter crassostrea]MBV7260337.1 LacI family DNA-binding transcriptional regulator [Erythrobacter crassostrea]